MYARKGLNAAFFEMNLYKNIEYGVTFTSPRLQLIISTLFFKKLQGI